jgi:pyruvate-formate lyase-activating enzyme
VSSPDPSRAGDDERPRGDRLVVSHGCATPCASCISCRPADAVPTLEEALRYQDRPDLYLGGGDATTWPHLGAFLDANAARPSPQRVWIEAPARALTRSVLADLARRGAHGVRVQIEGVGEAFLRRHGLGDGEKAIAEAEALGLATEARVCARPMTFVMIVPLARRLAPRTVWLELIRQDWGRPPVAMPPAAVEATLLAARNVRFSAHRMSNTGYLPPCVMPDAWARRADAWRATEGRRDDQHDGRNAALPACARCSLAESCQWNDPGGLSPDSVAAARPVERPRERHRATDEAVPEIIVRQRRDPEVVCVTPWTTMEVVDPDGRVRQCCSTWTAGDRGSVLTAGSLASVWNGPGYRSARRIMSGDDVGALCNPVCSRLHDRKLAEKTFRIQSGSRPFVDNQLLMAEDIARRSEEVRCKPLYIALCPSTYCNYDCVMCDLGHLPRRDLPESIWDELPDYLPTLKTLTLLGGEPLANPRTWEFLREFDATRYPDASLDLVTNGSLLTEKALERIQRCALGDVTISLNAGDPETYVEVQSPTVSFEQVLANIDALIRFRAGRPWWFGITLSFVVQSASAASLIAFAEIAHRRNLRARFMAVNPENHEHLDLYKDPDEVARVVGHVDGFIAWCEKVRPEWLPEARGVRQALLEESAKRQEEMRTGTARLYQLVGQRPPPKNAGKVALPSRAPAQASGRGSTESR